MKVLNFGSLNIDHVYSVGHIVVPGETISSSRIELFPGGKGLNQSVALSKAGVKVFHAGTVGEEGGEYLLNVLQKNGVDTSLIKMGSGQSGHAIIQVAESGQNSIILFGGTNRKNTREYVDDVLSHFGEGDIILLQNEINGIDYIIDRAYQKKMKIILNPSPMDGNLLKCDLGKVSMFILNEVEGEQITGKNDHDEIIDKMLNKYPDSRIVLTLGEEGSVYADSSEQIRQEAFSVSAVDTTAAGDTFTGYFIAGIVNGDPVSAALENASRASAIAVTRKGAAVSIPYFGEVRDW